MERLGVRVFLSHINRRGKGRSIYASYTSRIRTHVRTADPDLVHVLWGGLASLLTVYAVTDRPVIITFGGTDLLGCYYSRRESPLSNLSRISAVWMSLMAARRAHRIILVSAVLADALPRSIDPRICEIIPNGVDSHQFRPIERRECLAILGWSHECKHLLFPSSARREVKRFPLAVETVSILRQCGFRVELHQLDHVPHKKIPIYLNGADVVLMTSRHEGSPKVIREALACGRPVVSVAVGDVPELLAPLTASRVADDCPRSLAKQIVAVWDAGYDPESVARMKRVSWDHVALRTTYTYLDALGRSRELPSACSDGFPAI